MNYAGVTFSSGNACKGGQVTGLESLFYPDLRKINFRDIFLIMCEIRESTIHLQINYQRIIYFRE